MSRRRAAGASRPIREELEALARAYHRVHGALERAHRGSSVRRELEERLLRVRGRFDRLLDEWVHDDDVRRAWEEHLHNHAALPAEPPPLDPVAFRGESDAGSAMEIRRRGDEYEVRVDGALLERVAAGRDLESRAPGLTFRADGFEFHETLAAPLEAIEALSRFVERGGEPPWEHATELLEDGLIDPHFAVTPRGRRAIA